MGARIGAFVVGPVLTILVAIWTLSVWGPPWPTEPSFDPGFPTLSSPLDVPFSVANKSAISAINDLNVECGIEYFQGKNRLGGPTILREVGTSLIVKGQTLGHLPGPSRNIAASPTSSAMPP